MNTLFGLNKWVGRQIRGSADSDMTQYENRVHEARLDERRHDRRRATIATAEKADTAAETAGTGRDDYR